MFGTQTRVFSICVAVLLFATTAYSQYHAFTVRFTETRPGMNNAHANGQLYYVYYPNNPENSRVKLVYDYKSDNNYNIVNIYHYENKALYTMCPKCSAVRYNRTASPWYKDESKYERESNTLVDGSFYWFRRRNNVDIDVARILMTDASITDTNNFQLKQIVFEDGRTLTFTDKVNIQNKDKDSDWFQLGSDCSTPKCRVYADIIFVMDYSLSVKPESWKKGCKFAYDLLGTFNLDATEVAAAVLRFGGSTNELPTGLNPRNPSQQTCDRDTDCPKYCTPGTADYHHESHYSPDKVPDGSTAEYIAPTRTHGNNLIPLSTNKGDFEVLIHQDNANPNQFTCQGFGLQLAMDIWDSSSARRNDKGQNPDRIVIVVTDGYDQCPWTTKANAEKIKNDYHATLVEIGVGLENNDCRNAQGELKDVAYLKSIATEVGGSPYYYHVDSYNAIHTLVDSLASRVCDEVEVGTTGECTGCGGFCGCGKCMCPECDNSGSGCYSYVCPANDPGQGCKISHNCDAEKEINRDVCGNSCDPATNQCTLQKDCSYLKAQYPGECHVAVCVSGNGCTVDRDQSVCTKLNQNNHCLEWECAPPGDTSGTYDAATGCRVKRDKNKENQEKIDKEGKQNCYMSTCDVNTGLTKNVSLCSSNPNALSPKCSTEQCVKKNGVYTCDWKENSNPSTQCLKVHCGKNGWEVDQEYTQDYCEEHFGGDCKVVRRNPNLEGCCEATVRDCPELCQGTKGEQQNKVCDQRVISEGKPRTVRQCTKGICAVDNGQATCDFIVSDCYEDKKADAEKKNSESEQCCNPACGEEGKCDLDCVARPAPDNDCNVWTCEKELQSDGTYHWSWKESQTQDAKDCVSNECFVSVCKPEGGCERTPICTNKTNKCYSYTCDDPKSPNGKCVPESLLLETECMHQVCDENGEKQWVDDALTKCTLSQTYKCLDARCVYDEASQTSSCVYENKTCIDCDPCLDNSCDNATGLFNNTPKCNDGKFCTEDICTADGQCWYSEVRCAEEISMEGYPCFAPKCIEGSGNHTCVRKLIVGAYIDVCGNCFFENGGTESESSSVDLVACTNAPPKPVLTEGLAAASIALIILAAILVGAAITVSGVFGAKELINRAGGAKDQVAHTNPLFEGNETEMTNPTYDGQTM